MRAARPTADVALTNGGSLRAELPAGALTYGELYEALPFDDRFVTIADHGRRSGRRWSPPTSGAPAASCRCRASGRRAACVARARWRWR